MCRMFQPGVDLRACRGCLRRRRTQAGPDDLQRLEAERRKTRKEDWGTYGCHCYWQRAKNIMAEITRHEQRGTRRSLLKLLGDRDGNFVPILFVPVVQDGRKTYTISGAAKLTPLLSNIGTEERT